MLKTHKRIKVLPILETSVWLEVIRGSQPAGDVGLSHKVSGRLPLGKGKGNGIYIAPLL